MNGKQKCVISQPHLPQRGMIELDHVTMRWDNRLALNDVCLRVDEGDFFAITGPNGGGKTTMLRIILGLLRPTSGRVIFRQGGKEIDKIRIGYLPQKNQIDSRFPISVEDVVRSGLYGDKTKRSELLQKVDETLVLIGLEEQRRNAIGELSGGQLQRALLGRAIISDPRVLILDEPLSYIDKRFESQMYDIIDNLATHTTILLVSHEMSTIAAMANRHLIVDQEAHECSATHHYFRSDCD